MSFTPIPESSASLIASYSPPPPSSNPSVEIVQVLHRIRLLNHFRITPGSRVLEVGCGQGTCTVVLASAVGPDGHVDAIDPGSPDYGSPYTLKQAQEVIKGSEIGGRVDFWNEDLEGFLDGRKEEERWDCVVFTHCVWYLGGGEAALERMMARLKGRVDRILVAEWAMQISHPAALPHLLAASVRATLEAHNPSSSANIRCLLSPAGITAVAGRAGWEVERETIVTPEEGLLDGGWEVGDVKSQGFVEEIEKGVKGEDGDGGERVKMVLRAGRDAVVKAVEMLKGEKVRSMDVWAATFTQT